MERYGELLTLNDLQREDNPEVCIAYCAQAVNQPKEEPVKEEEEQPVKEEEEKPVKEEEEKARPAERRQTPR